MKNPFARYPLYAAAGCLALLLQALSGAPARAQMPDMPGMDQDQAGPKPHQDHNPQHGGIFFMAMDNVHHVEGVLVRPGVFRVYVYDAYTHPVKLSQLKKTAGKVVWGGAPDAPEIPLMVAKNGRYLEAVWGKPVKFPVQLTLLAHFPGEPLSAKPELFTFPFSNYTKQETRSHPKPQTEPSQGM